MNSFTDLDILDNGDLKISITREGLEEIAEMETRDDLSINDKFARLIEYHLCNGWDLVPPEDIGALTSSPVLSNDVTRDDHGKLTAIGGAWWFPNYQVINEVEELKTKGFVIFTSGRDPLDIVRAP